MGVYALIITAQLALAQAPPQERAQPTVFKTSPAKPTAAKPTAAKPTAAKPTAAKPTAAKPAAKPTAAKPKTSRKPKKAAEPPPAACKDSVDSIVKLVSGGLELLVAEVRKREDSNLDEGQAAFEAYMTQTLPEIDAARAAAITLEAGLTDSERGRCETYSFSAFHKMMVRYASVQSAYQSRLWVFRTLGGAFR